MKALRHHDLYSELTGLPASVTGEILNGQLYAHPRPGGRHVLVAANLGIEIGGPYHRGRGGPGGWWILQEPEVHLALDTEVVVPDLAGWRKSRLPQIPESHKFTIVPDWVCEILSPSTASVDLEIKKPLYARYGVQYLWIISPADKHLEAFQLADGEWRRQGLFSVRDSVSVAPFQAIQIQIDELFR